MNKVINKEYNLIKEIEINYLYIDMDLPLCYPELAHFGSKRIDKTESKQQFARIDIQAYCIHKN